MQNELRVSICRMSFVCLFAEWASCVYLQNELRVSICRMSFVCLFAEWASCVYLQNELHMLNFSKISIKNVLLQFSEEDERLIKILDKIEETVCKANRKVVDMSSELEGVSQVVWALSPIWRWFYQWKCQCSKSCTHSQNSFSSQISILCGCAYGMLDECCLLLRQW